ncbi:MAG: bifunctional UDP-N-acetylglucosamine diphosphorylase/glucosamine-1-phosphate N-acetyltransferase GlmU [Bacillota bacterium]|jgi:bifunctional UDP-N-acetylglucosamine pyrophosphorylase/glucosamine-1-phosphate N-acetyltransferase|nr:bifunctional UDP-N-acetylglucosamine diphosphorylase/glucosamine-1-phosphate N-acetyltransferase GlmU [Bacillota bacterium]
MKYVVIMAAGKGTRMQSDLPKVMHKVCNTPMIEHLIDVSKEAGADKIVSIVGYGSEIVKKAMEGKCEFALQEPQLGTGHAVMQAKQLEGLKGKTLVINGDTPCLNPETLAKLYDELDDCSMVVLTAIPEDASAYGRVIKNEDGYLERIVEFKDANEEERAVKEINTGIYGFDNEVLFESLKEIKNDNAQQEYYITDLVEIIKGKNKKVKAVLANNSEEVAGINDRVELARANKYMQRVINERLMESGVTIIDPDNTYISKSVKIEKDVVIYPNVHIQGNTVIGENTEILPQSFIVNSKIGKNNLIDSSHIVDSEVKDSNYIGPYAHLRMNCVVENKTRVGNFVEFKNVHFNDLSRSGHLTYLGDTYVGKDTNIGCGVVTINFDGKNKFRTTIKDRAFVGSNVGLIAPITVGNDAVVAAGTTANRDVEDGDMAIGRVTQENKPGYGYKYKNK